MYTLIIITISIVFLLPSTHSQATSTSPATTTQRNPRFQCRPALVAFIPSCENNLKALLGNDSDPGQGVITCCYFAEFRHCLLLKASQDCVEYIEDALMIRNETKHWISLNDKCKEYDYKTFQCYVVIHKWIIVGIIVAVITLIALIIILPNTNWCCGGDK